MCGIVGFVGNEPALPVILEGLKRLEYRGYDSAGIALLENGKLTLDRCTGKVSQLEHALKGRHSTAVTGLGHTRWATHGRPSEENAHPHTDCRKRLAVVHNGIVENYQELKRELIRRKHRFRSETDTEVLVHLIESFRKKYPLLEAVRRTAAMVQGDYAIGAISEDDPGRLVMARRGSPVVLGLGQDATYAASDIPAFLARTRRVLLMEDDELAEITMEGVRLIDRSGRPVRRDPIRIDWDPLTAEKGGYQHFMLKEIFEQPRAVEDTLRGKLLDEKGGIFLENFSLTAAEVRQLDRITLVACGTSWHAALAGKFMIEAHTGIPVEVDIGSEFRYRESLSYARTAVVLISQSGETTDTLAAGREAKARGAKIIAICNVVGSTLARESPNVLYTHAGPEIGVAATKTFTAQLTALFLLSVFLGSAARRLDKAAVRRMIRQLRSLPRLIERTLRLDGRIQRLARRFYKTHDFLFLGRGVNFPIALEGALKLKEISYIHAEGYPAGEMKHGPIALIDRRMPTVVIAPQGRTHDKILSNMEQIKAREGIVIALAEEKDREVARRADHTIFLPPVPELLSPIVTVIPLQLLAYHIAVALKRDPDQPRNLAKSVTVE